jgi:Cu/Ag efflux protein CusF
MRKLVLSLAVLTATGLSSVAFADTAPSTATGAIKALDAKACTVTLDNSTVYHFDAKCDFSKLKVGEKVAITWAAKDNADWASKIAAAS